MIEKQMAARSVLFMETKEEKQRSDGFHMFSKVIRALLGRAKTHCGFLSTLLYI